MTKQSTLIPTTSCRSLPVACFLLLLLTGLLLLIMPPRIAAALPADQTPQSADIPPLVTAMPVNREIAGGQAHQYAVTTQAEQFLRIVVEQKGSNVVVRVYSPDGNPVWEVNVAEGAEGREEVRLVAGQAGAWRIEVLPADQKAGAGRYEITLTELRAATQAEKDQWAAEVLTNEALALLDKGTRDSVTAAIKKLEEALSLARAAGYQNGEMTLLMYLGTAYQSLSQYQQALESCNKALSLARVLGDRKSESLMLNNIGTIYGLLGDQQQRLTYLQQALPLVQQTGDKLTEAVLLANLGNVAHVLGEYQKALDYAVKALPLLQALGENRFAAITLNNIGAAYRNLGETERALESYQQALPLLRADGDKQNEAATLDNIGMLYRSLQDAPKALSYFNQALELRRATGNKRGEAVTLDNIGVAWRMMGDPLRATEFHQQAQALFQSIGERYKAAVSLDNLGVAWRELGRLEQALDSHMQALPLLQAAGDRMAQAHALRNIAHVERAQKKMAAAQSHIEQAIALLEFVRAGVGDAETRASFLATVADFYEFHIDLLMQWHQADPQAGHDQAALRISEQARARSLLDILTESQADIYQGVAAQLRDRERDLRRQLTTQLDKLTRLLSGKSTEEQKTAAEKEIDRLTTEYRQVQAEIRQQSPRYAALTQPQPLSAREIQALPDADTLLLEYALGEKQSYLWVVSPTAISSYQLPSRAEIETVARKVYELLSVRPAKSGSPETEFAAQSAALSRMLLGPAAAQLGTKRLLIVAPGVLAWLPFAALPDPVTGGQLSVTSEERHQPPAPGFQPLITRHEIVNLPSASVLAVLRRENTGRSAAEKILAVLADPVFEASDPRLSLARNKAVPKNASLTDTLSGQSDDQSVLTRAITTLNLSGTRAGLTRLPFSREEADAIFSFVPDNAGMKATDFRANRATVTGDGLSRYRILHFATHGLLNSERPELSGLVLSLFDEQGRSQEGFLRLHEIYNLKLNADLVVLSACQTGLGREVRGEGLIGLTRGFMYAGAPRVVASLWQVDDLATAELMKRFYQGMLKEGLRPAAALRSAQLAMWQQRRRTAPYFWAAFTLQGEWK